MAYYFSAVKAFEERIRAAECGQERFQRMLDEYDDLFRRFDEAYKRTQKSELTAKITALNKERNGYAYVMQKVAKVWAAKLEDEPETGATSGNLSVQIDMLSEAGYISVEKGFRGKMPRTACRITPQGTETFRAYVKALHKYIAAGK